MSRFCIASFLVLVIAGPVLATPQSIDIAGSDHTGYLGLAGVKNWSNEASITATDGLPDYPYYQLSPTLWTSIAAEPLSSASSYAQFSSSVVTSGITDGDFATRSLGTIDYDDASLTGSGVETIPASLLSFTIAEDAFSPLYSTHNAGAGAGNAGWAYVINLINPTGNGLTFTDGLLTGIDFTADVQVGVQFLDNPAFAFIDPNTSQPLTYDGNVTFNGNTFSFDVDVIQDANSAFGPLTDTHLVFNRAGSIDAVSSTAIPAPPAALMGLAALVGAGLRRRSAA